MARLRTRDLPTVPPSIGLELETNPFLRTSRADIRAAVARHARTALDTPEAVFAGLRQWTNDFR